MFKKIAIILVFLLLLSCRDGSLTIENKNGITVYKNADSKTILKSTLVKKYSINAQNDSLNISYFGNFEFDSRGNIYTFDRKDNIIYKLDQDGNLLNKFGGTGSGPGEFNRLGVIKIVNDTLIGMDFSVLQVVKFDLSGKFQYSQKYSNSFPQILSCLKNNRFLAVATKFDKNKDIVTSTHTISIFSERLEQEKQLSQKTYSIQPKTDLNQMDIIYKSATGDTITYLANNDYNSYCIDLYNTKGIKYAQIEKSFLKADYPKQEHDTEKDYLYIYGIENTKKVAYKQAILNMFTDEQNRLWVHTPKNQTDKNSGLKFDLYQNMKLIGTTYLNLAVKPEFFSPYYLTYHNGYIFYNNETSGDADVYKITVE